MNRYNLKFKDFKTKESFIELQRYFLRHDYKEEFFQEVENERRIEVVQLKDPLDNPQITFKSKEDGKETYNIINFEEDFLIPKISGMSEKAFLSFQQNISRKGLHSEELKKGFALEQQDQINGMIDVINLSDYLGNKLKVLLQTNWISLRI